MMNAIDFYTWCTELNIAASGVDRLAIEDFRVGLESAPKPAGTQTIIEWLSSSTSMVLSIRDLQLKSAYPTSVGTVIGSMDVCVLLQNGDGRIVLADSYDPGFVMYNVSESIERLFLASVFVIEDELFLGNRLSNSERSGRISWLPRSVRVRRIAACLGGEEYAEFASKWLHSR